MVPIEVKERIRERLSQLPNVDVSNESLITLLLNIFDRMSSDAELLDRSQPGHRFAWPKFHHQVETVLEASTWCRVFAFQQIEIACFLIVCSCHDWGRMTEALSGLQTLRDGPQHGQLSVDRLNATGLLARIRTLLGSDLADGICAALIAHAEHKVELEVESLAWRIAYALRDLDKIQIIEDENAYFSPDGMATQLLLHYLGSKLKSWGISPEKAHELVAEFVADFIAGNRQVKDGFFGNEATLQEEVFRILTAEIPPDLIETFCARQPIEKRRVADGWGAHMFWHLSLAHDVQLKESLSRMLSNLFWSRRVDLVCHMVDEDSARRVRGTVAALRRRAGI